MQLIVRWINTTLGFLTGLILWCNRRAIGIGYGICGGGSRKVRYEKTTAPVEVFLVSLALGKVQWRKRSCIALSDVADNRADEDGWKQVCRQIAKQRLGSRSPAIHVAHLKHVQTAEW